MTKDGGLGAVDSTQKYIVAIQDTMNGGIAACRHANGRDWWVVAQKHDTDTIYKILFSPISCYYIAILHFLKSYL